MAKVCVFTADGFEEIEGPYSCGLASKSRGRGSYGIYQ